MQIPSSRTGGIRRLLVPALAAFSFAFLESPVQAVVSTWTGATDATWADANWSASVPGTGDTAVFNASSATVNGNTTLDLGTGVTVSTIIFDTANAAAYTIGTGASGSQSLTLNASGAVTMNSTVANDETINALLTLGTDASTQAYTFTNNSATNSLIFSGGITGGTGGTAGTETLTATGTGATSITGTISNGGATALALTKSGTGKLTLSGANTFSGTTTVSAGTLNLSNSLALQDSIYAGGAGTLVFDQSVASHAFTLAGLNGSGSIALVDNGANPVALTIGNNTTAASYSGVISGAGTLTKVGTAQQTITATPTFTGQLTVSAGTLEVDSTANFGAVSIAAGAVLTQPPILNTSGSPLLTVGPLTGSGTLKYGTNGAAIGNFTLNETSSTTFSGIITGVLTGVNVGNSMVVNKNGVGTLNLTATGGLTNYRGFVINAGTLEFSGNGTLADLGSSGTSYSRTTLAINQGATLTLDNTGAYVSNRLYRVDQAATISGGTFNLFGSSASNTVELVQTHGSVNSSSHGLIMAGGTDTVNATAGTGRSTTLTFGDVYVRNSGASPIFTGTNLGTTPGVNVATILFGTAPTLTGGATAGTPSYGVMAGTVVDSVISGSDNYSIATYDATNGVRSLTAGETTGALTASSNVKAVSALTNGTLAINSLQLGTGGSIDNTAGTLSVTSGTILSADTANSIGAGGGSALQAGATGATELVIYNAPSSNLTIGSTITSSIGLTKGGSGSTFLTANNASSLAGAITINQGTLSISAASALGAAANTIAINNGGTLQSTGAAVTLGSGAITLGGTAAGTIATATIDISGASTNTLTQGTGLITGVGSLTKTGVGTLTLSALNTYSGGTTVSGGTLLVNNTGAYSTTSSGTGTSAGAVSVTAGTIGGSGTVAGALTLASSATLSPGSAAGVIGKFSTGALTLSNTSSLVFDLGTTTTPGTTSDLVAVTGALTLGGNLTVNAQTGFGAGTGLSKYELFTYTPASGLTAGTVTLSSLPAGFGYSIDTATSGIVYLDVTAVPEPQTWVGALLLAGTALVAFRRRQLVGRTA